MSREGGAPNADTERLNLHFCLGGELRVSRLGYGVMRLTGQPGNFGPYSDWRHAITLLHRAAELGVNFFDSAWAYGPQWADRLLGEAFADNPDIVIATKGGVDKLGPGRPVIDCSRDTLLRQIDTALVNLRRDTIDLYQLHHIDPIVPLENSLAVLCEALDDGRIRHIGLSNVTLAQVSQAMKVAPIASVQNRFNLAEESDGILVEFCARHSMAYIAYAPLGADSQVKGARLSPDTALKWLLLRSPNVLAIPATTSLRHLAQNCSILQRD